MNFDVMTLLYFSPTGTTRKVLSAIAKGAGLKALNEIDLTPPAADSRELFEMRSPAAIIGCPVYTGRVPLTMLSRLRQIKGKNTPAVIVVVYGNRAYEDALRELRDVVVEAGFVPFAAAAFIGEHSYSNAVSQVAAGRPDKDDLMKAEDFGRAVRDTLRTMQAGSGIVQVPGNFPYKERGALANIAPVTDAALCTLCGTCASVCPTSAITIGKTVVTDAARCIRCCACTRACPEAARSMQEPRIVQLAEQLSKNCSARKEPEIFL